MDTSNGLGGVPPYLLVGVAHGFGSFAAELLTVRMLRSPGGSGPRGRFMMCLDAISGGSEFLSRGNIFLGKSVLRGGGASVYGTWQHHPGVSET